MGLLFRIDKAEKIILDKDVVKLCPNLKKLDDLKLLYIILAYDYYSPFHRFPEEERIRKAKLYVWNDSNLDISKDKLFTKCIEDYKGLQYDVKRETMMLYEEKIVQMNNELMVEMIPRKIKELDDAIERLAMRRQKMQEEIDMDEEASRIIQGVGKLSMIEKYQENMRKKKQSQYNRSQSNGVEFI